MASLLNAFLAGSQGGEQARERADERERRSSLASLMSQAYTQPDQARSLLPQIAAVDADAGMGAYKAFQQMDEDRRGRFGQFAAVFDALPDEQKAAAYPQFAAQAKEVLGLPVPDQWDPAFAPRISQIARAMGAGSAVTGPYGDLPSDIRSLKLLQENPELAALDRERRQAAGMVPKLVPTDQGYGWGTPGGGIKLAPLDGVAGAESPPAPEAGQLFAALGQKYGIKPTSVQRSPEHNRKVGGVPNSYHLSGSAADWQVPPQYKQQFIQDVRANGFEALDEGDHIHIEPVARGGAANIAQPKSPSASEFEKRLAAAREMGATEDELRRMVIGREGAAAGAKPMPAAALRMVTDARAALKEADTVNNTLARIRQEIASDQLNLGPVRNLINRGRVASGLGNDESTRFSTLMTSLRGLQNAALRLNKGVQTEGDAQRIWQELLGNLNDEQSVLANIDRLIDLNRRAVELHEGNLELVNENYGRPESAGVPQPASGASDPLGIL